MPLRRPRRQRLEPAVRRHLTVPCDIVVADEAGIVGRLADVDVVVTMAFTAEMGRAAPRLRLVQVPGAGVDRIDRAALPPGTHLANVYGHEAGIAEYVIGAMISLTRELARVDAALRQGDWQSQWAIGRAPPPTWPELVGRTLGILGYGRIGREVARRANDNLVVAMPATDETIGAIGHGQLRLMKPSAFLINVARAEIIDERPLYDALASGAIAGAALDVWYRYPAEPGPAIPSTCPFHELPNVLTTPHVAGWTDGMMEARARLITENIGRVAQRETPLNLVTDT